MILGLHECRPAFHKPGDTEVIEIKTPRKIIAMKADGNYKLARYYRSCNL